MAWVVRYTSPPVETLQSVDGATPPPDLLDRHASLVSELWDLGTSGVAEQPASLVAGFDQLETARRAQRLAGRHGLVADVETVDDGWVHHERVDVAVTTASGTDHFPLVAGAAFGHGAHPTTRLCIDLMSRVLAPGESPTASATGAKFLDLGTGTGVLAIAAHRLGATDITASDIDPGAIESARFNAEANGVDLQLVHGDIDAVLALAGRTGVGFDLIAANILLVVHEDVAPAAGLLLEPNGVLVVAGFLADQADRVVAAYRAGRPALTVTDGAYLDGWCGLVLVETDVLA